MQSRIFSRKLGFEWFFAFGFRRAGVYLIGGIRAALRRRFQSFLLPDGHEFQKCSENACRLSGDPPCGRSPASFKAASSHRLCHRLCRAPSELGSDLPKPAEQSATGPWRNERNWLIAFPVSRGKRLVRATRCPIVAVHDVRTVSSHLIVALWEGPRTNISDRQRVVNNSS